MGRPPDWALVACSLLLAGTCLAASSQPPHIDARANIDSGTSAAPSCEPDEVRPRNCCAALLPRPHALPSSPAANPDQIQAAGCLRLLVPQCRRRRPSTAACSLKVCRSGLLSSPSRPRLLQGASSFGMFFSSAEEPFKLRPLDVLRARPGGVGGAAGPLANPVLTPSALGVAAIAEPTLLVMEGHVDRLFLFFSARPCDGGPWGIAAAQSDDGGLTWLPAGWVLLHPEHDLRAPVVFGHGEHVSGESCCWEAPGASAPAAAASGSAAAAAAAALQAGSSTDQLADAPAFPSPSLQWYLVPQLPESVGQVWLYRAAPRDFPGGWAFSRVLVEEHLQAS